MYPRASPACGADPFGQGSQVSGKHNVQGSNFSDVFTTSSGKIPQLPCFLSPYCRQLIHLPGLLHLPPRAVVPKELSSAAVVLPSHSTSCKLSTVSQPVSHTRTLLFPQQASPVARWQEGRVPDEKQSKLQMVFPPSCPSSPYQPHPSLLPPPPGMEKSPCPCCKRHNCRQPQPAVSRG